jgi:hypothetical protein
MTFPLNDNEEFAVKHLVEQWCNNEQPIILEANDITTLHTLNRLFQQKERNFKTQEVK